MIDVSATVSVIVCGYTLDRWSSLVATMRSLPAQSLRPHEVILVIDHNPELLRRATARLPCELPDIRIVASAGRRGLSGARNTGVAVSHGEIVVFLDDDAVADPDWMERLVAPYGDAAVMVTGGFCSPGWETGRPWWFPSEFDWVVGCSYRGLPEQMGEIRNPIGAAMSMRRTALAHAGVFREDFGRVGTTPLGCEETEMAIRIRQRISGARILHVPSAVVTHAVPADRGRLRYFLSRCHAEGFSKAQVVRSVGAGDGLGSERAYVRSVLPSGVLSGLRCAVRGDYAGLGRAAMILAGLALTTVGFLRGSLRQADGCNTMTVFVFSDRRAALDASLIGLIGAAVVLSVVQVQPLSALVVLLAMCVVPGAALLTRLGASGQLTTVALAVGLSLAIDTGLATALAWSRWWHPEWAALAVAAGAAGLLLTDISRARKDCCC